MKRVLTSTAILLATCCSLFHGLAFADDPRDRDPRQAMPERMQDRDRQDNRGRQDSQGARDPRADRSGQSAESTKPEAPFVIPNNMRGCAILKAVEDKKDADGKTTTSKKEPTEKDPDFEAQCTRLLSTATSFEACADLGAYDPGGHFALVFVPKAQLKVMSATLKCASVGYINK